jgi:hypothetical protein
MAYTITNFKTKKALKEAVELYLSARNLSERASTAVKCYQPGLGPDLSNYTGKITLEGPHYPKPHTWYAEAWLEHGMVVKVK